MRGAISAGQEGTISMNAEPTQPVAAACVIALGSYRDGDLVTIPGGLKGTEVYTVISLRRIGFGSNSGDRFVGTIAYVEDAGVDPSSGASMLRFRAYSGWETPGGTALTHEERGQLLMYRRADLSTNLSEDDANPSASLPARFAPPPLRS